MAAHKFIHNGNDFVIEVAQLPGGKWIVRICPPKGGGDWIRQNEQQTTNPASGKTTRKTGRLVEFDSEEGAIDAAQDNIKVGMY